MPLPILKSTVTVSNADLLRFALQIELEWARHIGEETQLDCCTALLNSQLKTVHDANLVLNAAVAPGIDAAGIFVEVERHFAQAGCTCYRWTLNPSLPADRTEPLASFLLDRGYVRSSYDLLHLPHLPEGPVKMADGLKIIPARASFRHFRQLAEEQAARWKAPEVADAAMLHLDDPRYDALLALKNGEAAGFAGLLNVGEMGGIQDVFVSEAFRRQGVGRTLMARLLEVATRSLLRHVLICVDPSNDPAQQLYASFGFTKVGEVVSYAIPGSTAIPR